MDNKSILFLVLLLLIFGLAAGQTTMIQGKISCHNDKGNCCLDCPLISLTSNDSISTTPNKDGSFELKIGKSSGTFSLRFQSIGMFTLEIVNIPYDDIITLGNVYLLSCKKITSAKYKRISRKIKKRFKSQDDYRKFMADNFSEIVPIGGKRFYFDCSLSHSDFMINTISENQKVIRLSYRDLIK